MPKAKCRTHVSYGLLPNNTECIRRKVAKKLNRLALHAFKKHCGTKSTWIAPPSILADSYIRFLSKAQPYLTFMTQTPKSEPYFITSPKYTVLIHSRVVYAILLLCWSTPCFITLLNYKHQQDHIAEPYPILTHCWGIFFLITWLSNSQFQYIVQLYPIVAHCWGIANINTLLSYNLS